MHTAESGSCIECEMQNILTLYISTMNQISRNKSRHSNERSF